MSTAKACLVFMVRLFLLVGVLSMPAWADTFGNTNVTGSGTGIGIADTVVCSAYPTTGAGTITKMTTYVSGGSLTFQTAIYDSTAGAITGTALATSSTATAGGGGGGVDSTISYAFLASHTYYLCALGQSAGGLGSAYDTSVNVAVFKATTFPTWPNMTGAGAFTGSLETFATFTPAGGGTVTRTLGTTRVGH